MLLTDEAFAFLISGIFPALVANFRVIALLYDVEALTILGHDI